jgi:hypothetical protein
MIETHAAHQRNVGALGGRSKEGEGRWRGLLEIGAFMAVGGKESFGLWGKEI